MTDLLLYFLGGELAVLIIWGLGEPSRVYQFPFLAGCVFAFWAWPQFYGLHVSGAVPDWMLDKALLMSILCSGMCYVGYQLGNRPIINLNWVFDRRRLTHAALALTVMGVSFQYKVARLPDELTSGTQWSGLPVAYLFLAKLLSFGFAVAVFLILGRFTFSAFTAAAIGGFGYLDWIVFAGRRQAAIQFVLIIAMLLWFIRKKIPPRPVMACGILAGAILSYNIGIYRSAMNSGGLFTGVGAARLSDLKKMSATGSLERVTTEGGLEMRNAAYYIAATEELGAFDFGLYQWNALVFAYFPAQIFGKTAKENLMSVGGMLHIGENAARAYGYESEIGTTTGGITDAFASFWYFGCLEFFAIAYFMRRLYESALRGSPVWQIGCALMTVFSLHAITHNTAWFVAPWVHAALFLGPALVYARIRPLQSARVAPTVPQFAMRRLRFAGLPRKSSENKTAPN
jgi:hypothetical protein